MATVKPDICSNFSGNPGDVVQWQNIPTTGCKISLGTTTWPFNPGPSINLPTTSTITIKTGLPTATTYNFNAECCLNEVIKTVRVG